MKFEKKVFKDLDSQITESAILLEKLKHARKTLSEICEHEWYGAGHDSHYDWEKCSICGEERKA